MSFYDYLPPQDKSRETVIKVRSWTQIRLILMMLGLLLHSPELHLKMSSHLKMFTRLVCVMQDMRFIIYMLVEIVYFVGALFILRHLQACGDCFMCHELSKKMQSSESSLLLLHLNSDKLNLTDSKPECFYQFKVSNRTEFLFIKEH